MNLFFTILLSILGLTNFVFVILYFKRFRYISKTVERNSHYTTELGDWRYKEAIDEAILSKIKKDTFDKLESECRDLVQKTLDHSIEQRMQEITKEFADKYTVEHFEEQMKAKMAEGLGEQINQRILGYNSDRY